MHAKKSYKRKLRHKNVIVVILIVYLRSIYLYVFKCTSFKPLQTVNCKSNTQPAERLHPSLLWQEAVFLISRSPEKRNKCVRNRKLWKSSMWDVLAKYGQDAKFSVTSHNHVILSFTCASTVWPWTYFSYSVNYESNIEWLHCLWICAALGFKLSMRQLSLQSIRTEGVILIRYLFINTYVLSKYQVGCGRTTKLNIYIFIFISLNILWTKHTAVA